MENYVNMFKSEIFWKVLWNTLYYVILNVPLNIIIPLLVAVLLNQKLKGIKFFRTIYFLPVVSSMVAVALVCSRLYKPEYGLLNFLLKKLFGISGPGWLESETWAMPAMVIVSVWKNMGYNMVIFLAGLQNIPESFYEVSDIDGASGFKKFFNITLPLLSPTTFFVLIITIIGSFQVFEQTYVINERRTGQFNANSQFLYLSKCISIFPDGLFRRNVLYFIRHYIHYYPSTVPVSKEMGVLWLSKNIQTPDKRY